MAVEQGSSSQDRPNENCVMGVFRAKPEAIKRGAENYADAKKLDAERQDLLAPVISITDPRTMEIFPPNAKGVRTSIHTTDPEALHEAFTEFRRAVFEDVQSRRHHNPPNPALKGLRF